MFYILSQACPFYGIILLKEYNHPSFDSEIINELGGGD
jgi:hypothetical protein